MGEHKGEHNASHHTRQLAEVKKRLVQCFCRFWPLTRELKPDGSFRDTVVIKPNKVEDRLAKQACTHGC
jgi:hypothetical protein